jgi:hypothetical protein
MGTVGSFYGVKPQRHEAVHSPPSPSSAEVNNGEGIPPLPFMSNQAERQLYFTFTISSKIKKDEEPQY